MKVVELVVEGLIRQRVEMLRCSVASYLAVALLMQFYCKAATGEALGCQQAALHGLPRPRENI